MQNDEDDNPGNTLTPDSQVLNLFSIQTSILVLVFKKKKHTLYNTYIYVIFNPSFSLCQKPIQVVCVSLILMCVCVSVCVCVCVCAITPASYA